MVDFVKIQHATYQNTLNIFAYTTGICNYTCSYCTFSQFKTAKFLDLHVLYDFIMYLYAEKKQDIYIEIIGGEPTLDPNIRFFSDQLAQYYPYIRLGIYTNFSQDVSLYQKLIKNHVNLTITWHSQQNREVNQEFIKKLSLLPKKSFSISTEVHVMLEYGNVDESIQMFKLIRDKYDSTELRMLDHDFTTKRIYFLDNAYYSREDLLKYNAVVKSFKEYTKKKTIECISKDNERITYSVNDIYLDETFYSFKYWKCAAGKDYLYIDLNGDIYPCMKYYERKSNMIGNINSMSKIKFRHVICPFDRCPCVWEATKEKVLKNIS